MKKNLGLIDKWFGWLIVGMLAVMVVLQLSMGRVPICECGFIKLWHGEVNSSENSQHIGDFYTFSHVIHGFFFYYLFKRFLKVKSWKWWLVLAVLVEVAWELVENSSWVINRYRETTISLDYYGDSVINSVADVGAMVAGFWVAMKVSWKWLLVATLVMEIGVGWLIRDNLALNIIMLIYPFEAIKAWQMAG